MDTFWYIQSWTLTSDAAAGASCMPNKSRMLGVFELSAGAGAAGASEAKGLVALAPSCNDNERKINAPA